MIIIQLLIFLSSLAFAANPLDNFFKDKTKIDNPFELRDPFKAPQAKVPTKEKGFFSTGKGNYSNIVNVASETLDASDLKVVGVLIGKERRVMVSNKGAGSKVIILKEGMKIGTNGSELKAILPGGIVLVEKIINVYGQEEYLETVIPISR